MLVSAVKWPVLTWGLLRTDSLLQPFEELLFLVIQRWLHFSVSQVAAWFYHLVCKRRYRGLIQIEGLRQ